jgi:hypothetical protein
MFAIHHCGSEQASWCVRHGNGLGSVRWYPRLGFLQLLLSWTKNITARGSNPCGLKKFFAYLQNGDSVHPSTNSSTSIPPHSFTDFPIHSITDPSSHTYPPVYPLCLPFTLSVNRHDSPSRQSNLCSAVDELWVKDVIRITAWATVTNVGICG